MDYTSEVGMTVGTLRNLLKDFEDDADVFMRLDDGELEPVISIDREEETSETGGTVVKMWITCILCGRDYTESSGS